MTSFVCSGVNCVTSLSILSAASNIDGNDGHRLKHSRQPAHTSNTRSSSLLSPVSSQYFSSAGRYDIPSVGPALMRSILLLTPQKKKTAGIACPAVVEDVRKSSSAPYQTDRHANARPWPA